MLEQEEAELQVGFQTKRVFIMLTFRSFVPFNPSELYCSAGLDGPTAEEPVAVAGGADRERQEESSPSQGQDPESGERTEAFLIRGN